MELWESQKLSFSIFLGLKGLTVVIQYKQTLLISSNFAVMFLSIVDMERLDFPKVQPELIRPTFMKNVATGSGPGKICKRQPFKKFTWSVLEYFDPFLCDNRERHASQYLCLFYTEGVNLLAIHK